ncbi:glycosyltransferase family 4 protein [Cohnella lupini]|uniref:Glycosyltransferase involved in cell wall biosynthesis n=1 Tax=Cohnella lupini TaxID=1294267 RepID=A0A3D9ITG7_9BACL|nr:glycosyltransferase family 1 protein [Cohnella lupini]RED65083.1 glycosyltransferase involved in cell wall biosynthesis [Cohnella lupini]
MNIYVNARFLTQTVTGVQRYAIELIKQWDQLLEEEPDDRRFYSITLLSPPGAIHELDLKHIKVRRVGSFGGHAWEQLILPYYARKGLLINLCNTGPIWKRKQIATMHDTAVFDHPEAYSFLFRSLYRFIQKSLGKRAQRVLTVSQFSKSRLIANCRIKEDKIRVVSLGMEHMQKLDSDREMLSLHELVSKGYVLAVSSMNPTKNFPNIVRAIEMLNEVDYQIVIAGGTNGKVFGTANVPHSDKLKWVGYVTDPQLKALYDGAACFIFPSTYEGFGLPPLEAMTCGAPVIVSRSASLPEVCGEATLYCDPIDPRDIAEKIDQVMASSELRQSLRLKGLRRAAQFSWNKCAKETWEAVKEVVHT